MVHLKPRSELFKKFAGLVYDGEKLESVSITAYRGREFYGRCSKLTISTLSELSVWGKKIWKEERGKKKRRLTLKTLTASGIL